jgi:hypothetical protein
VECLSAVRGIDLGIVRSRVGMTMPRGQHWISKAAATAGSISHFAVAIEHSDQLSALPPPFSPTPCPNANKERGGGGRRIKAPEGERGAGRGREEGCCGDRGRRGKEVEK